MGNVSNIDIISLAFLCIRIMKYILLILIYRIFRYNFDIESSKNIYFIYTDMIIPAIKSAYYARENVAINVATS